MLHLQKFARWYSVLHELKFKLLTVFFTVQVMDNVLFSRTLRQCTFTCLNISVHYETLPFNIIIFLKQVTKDYFCSIFSWLYYLLLQIPPIKITVVYAKYFQILKSIESNWALNIQTYGTTKPNTNFSISQWYHETLKSLKTSTIYCTPN